MRGHAQRQGLVGHGPSPVALRCAAMVGIALIGATLMAAPATAKVERADDSAFIVTHEFDIAAAPASVWATLVKPERWWSAAHSWSGNAANFRMTPVPGGCFCETLPAKDGQRTGFAEHARVIHAKPGELLRLSGALGPLQSEALTGTLTFTLAPGAAGTTKVKLDYIVGGVSRMPLKSVAPAVDKVLGEQMTRLQAAVQPQSVQPKAMR